MSYPTRLDLFRAWAKAMEQGATVGRPSYPGTSSQKPARNRRKRRRLVRRRKRKQVD